MSDAVEKVLLLPRFSSYAGPGPFYTAPMNIRAYRSAFVTAWRGLGIGAIPNGATLTFEESTDLGVWIANSVSVPLTANAESTSEMQLTLEWLRLKIELSSSASAITVWAVANFVRRED